MKEKKEGVIRLKDTSRTLMEEVLEYVYTGHVDVNEEKAYDLMALGDYLLIPNLKHRSSNFIEEILSVSNCILAYYSSVKYQCVELQERARKFVLANFMAVTESEDFLYLNVKQVEEWIASDELVVKGEEQAFMAILRCTERNTRRKQSFFDLFRHVRCVCVTQLSCHGHSKTSTCEKQETMSGFGSRCHERGFRWNRIMFFEPVTQKLLENS